MTDPSSQPRQCLAVVTEAFLDLPLPEMLETLANPYGLMGRAMLEQMKLVK